MQQATAMPTSHVDSLSSIETGYWWYLGRCYWAASLLERFLPHPETSKYVDVGCGTGGFAQQLVDRLGIKQTLLVDADPAVLRYAEQKGNRTLRIDFSNNFQLPWKPTLVSCMDVLEHIADDASFLKRLNGQMETGSYLVASVPAHPSLFSEWDKQLGHYRRYTRSALRARLEDAGFEVETLTHQWSFLIPAGPIRKMKTKRYQTNMEFEAVSPWLNSLLFMLSRIELALAHKFPLPFGTSLMVVARKK